MTDDQFRELMELQRKQIELLERLLRYFDLKARRKPLRDEDLRKYVIETLEGLSLQMTQRAISRSIGVTPACVSYYINGKLMPSSLVIKKIRRLSKLYPPKIN